MDNIYSSVISFFNDNNQIDYQKIKLLVEKNLERGQNKFYVEDNLFNNFHLNFKDKKKHFKEIVKLFPETSKLLIELDYNFLNGHQEIIGEFNNYQKDIELVITIPAVRENKINSCWEECLSYLNLISRKYNNCFYISFDTKFFNSINSKKIIEKINTINNLKGFVIRPTYAYDLDFKEFIALKEIFSRDFIFLAAADDFYLLNSREQVMTISKYINLIPNFFKKIKLEFENNNLVEAKKYQLVLNDFITKVENVEQETAFRYLLAKPFAFEFNPKKPLSKAKKTILDSEFEKINGYFVDKV